MGCYPVDSADARDLAERDDTDDEPDEDDPLDWRSRSHRIPCPPDIAEQIRRTLADKRKRHSSTDKAE